MTNPRASKGEQDSSEVAKKGFFKKILNKVSSKKGGIEASHHKTSSSISSQKSAAS